MKILHTSDWHLGKRLEKFSRFEEQKEVLEEICNIANGENVDAIIIAGDIFDTFNPSTESIELFYKTVKKLSNNGNRAVITIAGNHDSPDRIEAPDSLARECGIILAGYPNSKIKPFHLESGLALTKTDNGFIELQLPNSDVKLRIINTPYANENRLKTYLSSEDNEAEMRNVLQKNWQELADKYCDDKGINILLTHLFIMRKDGEKPEESDDEKPILHIGGVQAVYTENIPKQIQYTAIGHLHRKQIVNKQGPPVIYSGSPIAYSMSESNQDKYVIIATIEPAKPAQCKEIKLTKGRKLLRHKFDNINEAVIWLSENPNTLVELTIQTDTFLTAEQRKQLLNAHDGIIAIIPEVASIRDKGNTSKNIDLDKPIKELFIDYFKYKLNLQEPNKEIFDLFDEIISQKQEL